MTNRLPRNHSGRAGLGAATRDYTRRPRNHSGRAGLGAATRDYTRRPRPAAENPDRQGAGPRRLSRTLEQWRARFLLRDLASLLAHACLPAPVRDYILTRRPRNAAENPA